MKQFVWITGVLLLLAATACHKNPDEINAPKEEQTKFPAPAWKADETGRYPASMTAVVSLPVTLRAAAGEGDQLAAFVDGECRGTGVQVKLDTTTVYFILIRGLTDEQSPVVFQYYNAKSSYLYKSEPVLRFLTDKVYGTAQNPEVLALSPVK
jgi:hypothetical protein